MKKLSFILLAAVALFASCSKHDTVQAPKEEAWLNDLSLPVPIQFGSNNAITKAPVDNFAGMTDTLGIIGVDETLQSGTWALNVPGSVLFGAETAVKAKIKEVADPDGGESTYEIAFTDGPKYYPLYSENNYTFYGYYPYRTASLPSGNHGYQVQYQLGDVDILWAIAKADDYQPDGSSIKYEGYNARYIRKITADNKTNLKPVLTFDHLLTALEFSIVAKSENGQPVKDVEKVKVTDITVLNTYKSASLLVASRDASLESGTFVAETMKEGPVALTMEPELAEDEVGYTATVEGLKLGTLMLISDPTAYTNEKLEITADNTTFYVQITVLTAIDNYASPVTKVFKLPVQEYEAGVRYKLDITVQDLETITLTAKLNPWGNGTVPSEPGLAIE